MSAQAYIFPTKAGKTCDSVSNYSKAEVEASR